MGTNIYVGNLAFSTTSEQLSQLFAAYGTVASATVIKDKETNRSKGFAFVEMSTDDEAQAAITALNDQDFQGRKLRINEARPREERPNNGPRRPFNNNNNNTRRKF